MRVLIDACVDPRIVELFLGHETRTAFEMGWQALPDNLLLEAIQNRFDVLVTADQGFEFQHNLGELLFGVIIVHVPRNKIEFYRQVAHDLQQAIMTVRPGEVFHVSHSRKS